MCSASTWTEIHRAVVLSVLLSFHNMVIEDIDYIHTAVKYGVTPLLSVCEQKTNLQTVTTEFILN